MTEFKDHEILPHFQEGNKHIKCLGDMLNTISNADTIDLEDYLRHLGLMHDLINLMNTFARDELDSFLIRKLFEECEEVGKQDIRNHKQVEKLVGQLECLVGRDTGE